MARLLLATVVASLAALAFPLSAAAQESWDSIRGLYLRQNYAAQVALEQHASQSWEMPQRIKTIPVTGGPGSTGVYPNSGAGGGAVVERGMKGPGPGGQVIDVQVRQVFPRAKILDRVVQAIPIVGTAAAVGLTIKELIDSSRVMEGPGGTILMDPGQPEQMGVVWRGTGNASVCVDSIPANALGCAMLVVVANSGGLQGPCNVQAPVQQSATTWRQSFFLETWNGSFWSCNSSYARNVVVEKKNELTCPDGQMPSFWADDWCTTAVEQWTPATAEQAEQRIEPRIAPGADPELLRDLDKLDQPVGGDLPSIQGPAAIHQRRETTQNPDGSTTVKDTTSPIEYGPIAPGVPGYEWGTREEVRTYPPGAEIPPPDQVTTPPDTSTGTDPGSAPVDDLITCGLPWTPPCKMDETGTPQAPPDTSQADAEGILAELSACLADPAGCLPEFPDLSWTFALPTGCAPVGVPFGEFGFEAVDMCQWQPMVHDLVSLLWLAAGLFGAVRIVSRESFGS